MKKIIFLFITVSFSISCKNNTETKPKTINTQKQPEKETVKNCSREVAFGDTSFCLPKVTGWIECYENPKVKQRFDPFDTSNNTTLAYYLSDETYKNIAKLNKPTFTFDNYYKVYAPNQAKNKKTTIDEMKQVVNMMSSSFISKTMEETNEELQKKGVTLTQPILLEKYQPQSNSSSVVLLMSLNVDAETTIMAMEMTATVLKDRLVFIAYYLNYKDEKTIKELKKNSDFFIQKLNQYNK